MCITENSCSEINAEQIVLATITTHIMVLKIKKEGNSRETNPFYLDDDTVAYLSLSMKFIPRCAFLLSVV